MAEGQPATEQDGLSLEFQSIDSVSQTGEENPPPPESQAPTFPEKEIPITNTGQILTIDKDPQVGDLYKRYLTNHNYSVVTLTELDQAVTVARGLQPSVITLDVAMHVRRELESASLDGWQVLKALRTDPGTRHIPVLVCTILNQEQRAFRLGASGYLLKPILEEDLIQAIQNLLNKR
jgi:CheY-like chemotaxis protein